MEFLLIGAVVGSVVGYGVGYSVGNPQEGAMCWSRKTEKENGEQEASQESPVLQEAPRAPEDKTTPTPLVPPIRLPLATTPREQAAPLAARPPLSPRNNPTGPRARKTPRTGGSTPRDQAAQGGPGPREDRNSQATN